MCVFVCVCVREWLCADSNLVIVSPSDMCRSFFAGANSSYATPFASDCLDWTYYCSAAFDPSDESVAHANCTDAPVCSVLTQRSYQSVLRIGRTVVMPGTLCSSMCEKRG